MNIWRGIVKAQVIVFVVVAVFLVGLPAAQELTDRPEPSIEPITQTTETAPDERPGIVDANDFKGDANPNTSVPDERPGIVDANDFNTTTNAEQTEGDK